jgi:hypothetical protein
MIALILCLIPVIALIVYALEVTHDNKEMTNIQVIHDLIDNIQKYGSTGRTWFRKGEVFNCMTIKEAKELLWVMIKIRDYRGINTLKEFRIPIIVEARSLYGLSTWDYLNTWYRSDLVELYEKVCKQRKGHIYDIYPYYFEGV